MAMLFLFVCFKITSDFLDSRERFDKAVVLTGNAMAALLAINTITVFSYNTLAQELTGFFFTSAKLSWPFEFSGQLGISLTLLFPVCLCSRSFPWLQRVLLYVMLIVNAGAIASRSVFWLCLFEIIYIEFFVYAKKVAAHNILKGLGLFCIMAALIVFFGEDFNFQRSLGQLEASPLLFDEPRMMTLRKTLQTVPAWIQGYGLGCFKAFNELEIHNTPLSILVETGFMGFISAFMFIVTIFKSIWWIDSAKHQTIKKGLIISFAAILFNGMFRNLLTNRACWFILALCYCSRHFQKDLATDMATTLQKTTAAVKTFSEESHRIP
ncbi:MAG: hypothetical protein KKB51_21395 [Candidatus Riflebacteria bacterium]|nr:hypothetical protein [Candidatus Riflebacteria bacterium]